MQFKSSAERNIAVVGLGYVGLPLAVAFGRQGPLLGFDIKQSRIEELRRHEDSTREVEAADLKASQVDFTADPARLREADFIIVAVPTPINHANRPDLTPVERASQTVGANLSRGAIVVYESTVYPGVTEDVCAPILEKASGLKCGVDFWLGYSPERINPGDKVHTLEKIVKIVSGQTPEVLDVVAGVYERVVQAGVYRAPNIKTAEAAKVIENTQRDLNIALVNELALIFDRMGIDTLEVLEAAGTKWNFLPFRPGLVGGHCIGVDPYYLTHKAEELGYHPQVILAGRRINDQMGAYVAQKAIKLLARGGRKLSEARIAVFGLTFKEDVPDLRNSKVFDIIGELLEYGAQVYAWDPVAEPDELKHEVAELKLGDFTLLEQESALKDFDAVILAVAHQAVKALGVEKLTAMLKPHGVIIDVKCLFKPGSFPGVAYWRL